MTFRKARLILNVTIAAIAALIVVAAYVLLSTGGETEHGYNDEERTQMVALLDRELSDDYLSKLEVVLHHRGGKL